MSENEIPEQSITAENLAAESINSIAATDRTAIRKVDAKSRGLRTLAQSVAASVLTYLGTLGADLLVPGFELSYEAQAVGVGIALLTPVLAYLQRRAGK